MNCCYFINISSINPEKMESKALKIAAFVAFPHIGGLVGGNRASKDLKFLKNIKIFHLRSYHVPKHQGMVREFKISTMETSKLLVCTRLDRFIFWHGLRVVFGMERWRWFSGSFSKTTSCLIRDSTRAKLGLVTDFLSLSQVIRIVS